MTAKAAYSASGARIEKVAAGAGATYTTTGAGYTGSQRFPRNSETKDKAAGSFHETRSWALHGHWESAPGLED